ncbi:related to ankyrin [Phialocephala subalpina]|uniref:Related to ankyrin n=1 Tax=Phialocephala subalpina TaxID=576137 RepID=A0A1L7WVD2_9HELO|nr:related to ankyrin [Phialocephala subalpina]
MDPLSLTGTLIAVLQITTSVISVCYDYRAGVASASRDVIQITDSLNALKDSLDALLRLVETSRSGEDRARLVNVELLAREGGALESCLQELERLKEKLEPETGWRKVKKSLTWPLKEGEMKKALAGLERYKSTMQLAISADQATLSLAIKDDLEDLTAMLQKHTFDQTRQGIFKWLAAPDPFVNHVLNRKKRQGSTGTWLLTSKQYDSWLHGKKSFLWLYGIPGCGKTVLCSTIIEQLIRYSQQDASIGLAYFYFDFNDPQKQDIGALACCIITQLVSQCPTIPGTLAELYEMRQNDRKAIDEEMFLSTLRSIILLFHSVYLVFDALDESSNCDETLQLIHRLNSWAIPQLHLLVTSRQITSIEDSLLPLISDSICLHNFKINKDVHVYISDKLDHDPNFMKWPSDIRKQITIKLVQGEAGMFQWVVCQLDMLQRCLSVAAVRKALSADFPKDLEGTYDQILYGVQQSHQSEALKVLQALIATEKPLTPKEIVDVLAVDLDADPPTFEPDARLIDPRSILSVCPSLITTKTYRRHAYDIYAKPTTVLLLSHASVADYLAQPKPPGLSQFQISKQSARRMLGQICLAYLMASDFRDLNKKSVVLNSKAHPFLQHAVQFWPNYLQRATDDPDDRLDEATRSLTQAFFATSKMPNGGNFAFWVGMLIPNAPIHYIANTHPLYYAASFGLLEVVQLLLDTEKGIDINALGGRAHSSALHVATFRDHIDVVKLLLEHGADPNLPNEEEEPPLYWAIANGNHAMVDLLLANGAEPKNQQQFNEIVMAQSYSLSDMPDSPSHDPFDMMLRTK